MGIQVYNEIRHLRYPLRAVNVLMRKEVGYTAVSATKALLVTLLIWQHGAKENYCKFAIFKRIVDTKTIRMGPNINNC